MTEPPEPRESRESTEVTEVPLEVLERVRPVCLALPDAYEEPAWVGVRWRIRRKTFAHLVTIEAGWPPAYVKAAGTEGPATVLTFRVPGPELGAIAAAGHPYFKPPWAPDIVGLLLDDEVTDWDEVAEHLVESYCLLAPRRLAALVERPKGMD